MNRLIKKLARTLWRTTAPVRRPLVSTFDQHLVQLVQPLLLVQREPSTDVEATALRSVVRELGRLQSQSSEPAATDCRLLQSSDRNATTTERPDCRSSAKSIEHGLPRHRSVVASLEAAYDILRGLVPQSRDSR